MNAIRPLLRAAQLFYFRWALAEIHPLHPDVGYIVHRLAQLRSER